LRRSRSIRHTCPSPGQSRYVLSRVVVMIRRTSTRPCPLSRLLAWSSSAWRRRCSRGGKGRGECGPDIRFERRLILFDAQEIVSAVGEHFREEIPLGESGIPGDQGPLDGDQLQQLQRRLMLVGLARYLQLGDGRLDRLAIRSQEMDARQLMPLAAAQGL